MSCSHLRLLGLKAVIDLWGVGWQNCHLWGLLTHSPLHWLSCLIHSILGLPPGFHWYPTHPFSVFSPKNALCLHNPWILTSPLLILCVPWMVQRFPFQSDAGAHPLLTRPLKTSLYLSTHSCWTNSQMEQHSQNDLNSLPSPHNARHSPSPFL